MSEAIWTRATIRLARGRPHDPRYLLHQAICTLWDGEVRPVWRVVREVGGMAEVVVLSRDMMRGRPRGRWGEVEGVRVGPVRVPEPGDRVVFVGSVVATAEADDERRALVDAYPDEDPGELYGAYVQRRLGDVAMVRHAEVHRIGRHVLRRNGRRRGAIHYDAADVAGTMIVHDGRALVSALCGGIGRGKAFGFGLLTLSGEDWSWWR